MKRKELIENLIESMPDFDPELFDLEKVCSALRSIEKEEKNPWKVANLINKRLQNRFNPVFYKASPQRVYGLARISYSTDYDDCMPDELDKIYDFKEFEIFSPSYLGIGFSSVRESARVLYPYFKHANEQKTRNDSEFGNSVGKYLIDCCKKVREKFSHEEYDKLYSWIKGKLKRDWKKELSREEFLKNQSYEIRSLEGLGFSEVEMYDRLLKRGMEKNPEYRKLVLCRWLINRSPKDYYEALEFSINNLNFRKNKSMELKAEDGGRFIIEEWEKLTRSAEFIREALIQYKGFAEEYLQK